MTRTPSGIVDVDTKQLDDVLRRVEESLDSADFALTKAVFESYASLADLVEDKNTSLRRLRQLLFGNRTETTAAVLGDSHAGPVDPVDAPGETTLGSELEEVTPIAPPGHGRNGAGTYQGGERIDVLHPSLAAGDACPECQRGTL